VLSLFPSRHRPPPAATRLPYTTLFRSLLERRLTSERPAVAARAAAAILGSKRTGTSRREFTRVLMRQLVQMSGIVEIGDDDPEHLDALMNHVSGNVELMFQSTTLF